MPDIFISYAREDQEVAKRIYKDLKSEGYDVWIDCENLLGGSNWQVEIKKSLRSSRYAIVLLSQYSTTKKGYINREIREALDILDDFPESETFIIPCRLEKCEPGHQRLNDLQRIDFFPSYERGLAKLYRSLEKEDLSSDNVTTSQCVQKTNRIVRLRGDSIVLPDGGMTNPIAVIASTRESLYEMAKALTKRHLN
ncbi:MAG: toll/interleukin-1 receptor domain-containing protein, partial [Merismopedia sp. SIO2A8]|nr:toll/interleukin-1 receptor domain-containing protein [Merismopedia sp. SIO2A8]